MNNQYIFVANWKMNLTFNQSLEFATANFDEFVGLSAQNNHKIVLCPSFESLYPIIQMFKKTEISIGAQDCSAHTNGTFTGQVSTRSLQEIGCTYCIVGHSESRSDFSMTNEKVSQKFIHLLDYDVTPILCVGETKQEFDKKNTLKTLESQLEPVFKILSSKTIVHSYLTPIIAYEPTWSVGTGKVADIDHLETVFSWIAEKLHQKSPNLNWKLLYGGSVTPENINRLKKIYPINGFLIGSSSLDFQKFEKIVK